MDKAKAIEASKELFNDNPKIDVAYVTSDGKAWHMMPLAEPAAEGLKDKKIVTVKRSEVTITE